jgi:cholesterol transport system auxiliary component
MNLKSARIELGIAMTKMFAPLLFGMASVALLSSCVNLSQKAPPSMLILSADQVVANGTLKSGAAADAWVVIMPDVPRKLDTNRVPVQSDQSNIAYLKDALWSDKPARLMQNLLMEVIAAKNGVLVLNQNDAGGNAGHILSGSLLEFGLDSQSRQAVIIYDVVRMRSGKAIDKKRFEARENVGQLAPGPAGDALNRAANRISIEIAAWLAAG